MLRHAKRHIFSTLLVLIGLLALACGTEGGLDSIKNDAGSRNQPLPQKSECEGSVNYPSFKCEDHTWTHTGPLKISGESLRIDSNRPVLVKGNVSIDSDLEIILLSDYAGIAIVGCITSEDSKGLVLDYRAGWPLQDFTWVQVALSQGSTCTSHVPYRILTPKGCTRASEVVEYDASLLRITFTTTHATCKKIIALSIGGAAFVLLLLGAVVLLIRRWRFVRQKFGYSAIND